MPDRDESPQLKLEDLSPEDADRIIHTHRKVRYGTACWPCRQRKVKCDNKSPCENCVRRDHASLCQYRPSNACRGGVSLESRKRRRSADNGSHDAIQADDGESAETSRYLGQNSIPALLKERASPIDLRDGDSVEGIGRNMRSILGLDNSAPFPLMSSHHLDRLTQDISSELPSDREVMKLFRAYKEIPQPFWDFVMDVGDLESRLLGYLEDRAKNAKATSRTARPVSAAWLAVLFAVLAVGSQYHDSPYAVRTQNSQHYIQISFQFLRVGNFLLRPNLDSIQALLMTSFVLLNDMKAEASWALLGLTCRLAQSLGLHLSQTLDGRESVELRHKETVRRRLWWTCVWHDTLTSLSFDRAPMTNIPCCPIPLSPSAERLGYSYIEAMYQLNQIICQRLNPFALADANYAQILDNCQVVESVRQRLSAPLRDKDQCRSALDRLQHFAIRLHSSFIVSVCCRPALRRGDSARLTALQKRTLTEKCKENLTETVRMFLSMHQLSIIPTRSWAFTYHGLSSAVLLGIMLETKTDPVIRQLQGDLISALSATAAKEQRSTPPPPHIPQTDRDIELSGPLSRALTALRNIYQHGSVIGSAVKSDSPGGGSGPASVSGPGSGARTPMAVGHLVGSASSSGSEQWVAGSQMPPLQSALDFSHQNAPPAMAEMQQQPTAASTGAMLDFAGMEYSASFPHVRMLFDTMPSMESSTYMSPMDLYDSIFWQQPDPFNAGFDSMKFDFYPRPPPGQHQQQFHF